jgi:hypothetical protein
MRLEASREIGGVLQPPPGRLWGLPPDQLTRAIGFRQLNEPIPHMREPAMFALIVVDLRPAGAFAPGWHSATGRFSNDEAPR